MGIEISVVVPTYRRAEKLLRLADALARQTLAPERWEVLVVDDCSGADYEPVLTDFAARVPARVRVLHTPANGGPDRARNVGWPEAEAPILAFCDDDVIPDDNWLEAGLKAMQAQPALGVMQGRTRLPDGILERDLTRFVFRINIAEPGPYFETCNIFYARAALEQVGGFSEDIGIGDHGILPALDGWVPGNDTATGWRVIEAGWGRGFAAEASAVHETVERGVGWYVRTGFQEHGVVQIAARHPGFRREAFWRPWAQRRSNAAFVLALVSGIIGLWWRPALAGVLPYAWVGRPARHDPKFWQACAETVLIDAARCAGHVTGSIRSKTLVL